MSIFDLFASGDYEAAWSRIQELGDCASCDPSELTDAGYVVTETMRRVRRNIDVLRDELPRLGWNFEAAEEVRVNPSPTVTSGLDRLAAAVGPLPMSLRAFATEVGFVNLNGGHDTWAITYPDPLMVDARPEAMLEEYVALSEAGWFEEVGPGPFPMKLAPDALHKADVSGGEPYAIYLPDDAIDAAWVESESSSQSFVEYLRDALLNWAGLPGWARGDSPTPPEGLIALAEQLERF